MKKIFRISLACFVFFLSIDLQAKEIGKLMAEKIAANVFAKLDNKKDIANFQIKEVLTVNSDDILAFYIVNFNHAHWDMHKSSQPLVLICNQHPLTKDFQSQTTS
jgi:nucleoside permease NupC